MRTWDSLGIIVWALITRVLISAIGSVSFWLARNIDRSSYKPWGSGRFGGCKYVFLWNDMHVDMVIANIVSHAHI